LTLRLTSILAAIFLPAILAACASSDNGGTTLAAPEPGNLPAIALTGDSFQDGGEIPREFTCNGAGKSPNLLWHGTPDQSKSTVVWLDDPDAGNYVQWLVFDIPPAESGLMAGIGEEPILEDGSHQGKNSAGRFGYSPPCPPEGLTHHYEFHVYSLDRKLDLNPGASNADVEKAMRQHIIAFGKLTATYTRPKSN
jgi:Raf kinase inhibitor-like YbhB/YbcL family protein